MLPNSISISGWRWAAFSSRGRFRRGLRSTPPIRGPLSRRKTTPLSISNFKVILCPHNRSAKGKYYLWESGERSTPDSEPQSGVDFRSPIRTIVLLTRNFDDAGTTLFSFSKHPVLSDSPRSFIIYGFTINERLQTSMSKRRKGQILVHCGCGNKQAINDKCRGRARLELSSGA